MEAVGARIVEEYAPLMIEAGDLRIPIRHYLFELPKTQIRMHVFWIVWENRNMDIAPEELQSLNYKTQWIQLLKGRRDFSRQVLLVSMAGMDDAWEARRVLKELLSDWLVAKPG